MTFSLVPRLTVAAALLAIVTIPSAGAVPADGVTLAPHLQVMEGRFIVGRQVVHFVVIGKQGLVQAAAATNNQEIFAFYLKFFEIM